MKKKLLFLIPALFGLFIASCGGGSGGSSSGGDTPGGDTPGGDTPGGGGEPFKKDFTDVFFDSATYTYDGASHILAEVRGAPENTTITYTGRNEYTNVGTYNATAKLVKSGYNDKTLSATLTINKADFSGLKYESKTVTYDGKEHISDIQLVGVLPANSTTKETITDSDGTAVTSAIEVGTYKHPVSISNSNFNSLTLTATLTIKAQKKDMPVFVANDGNVYFANGLHNSYL